MSTGPPIPEDEVPATLDSPHTDSSRPSSSIDSPSSVGSLPSSSQPSPAKSLSSSPMSARHQSDISPTSGRSVMSSPTRLLTPRRPVSRFRSLPYSSLSRRSPLFSGSMSSATELAIHEKLDTLLARVGAIEEMLRSQSFVTDNSPQPVLSSTVCFNEPVSVEDESELDDIEPDDELLQFCVRTKLKNVSMTNFATILVEKLFTEEERYNRNCRGGDPKNKEALNPKKLRLVKRLFFSYFRANLYVDEMYQSNR